MLAGWEGLQEVKLTQDGKLISSILNKYFDSITFEISELASGIIILDVFSNILGDGKILKEIYRNTGFLVQAFEISNAKVRFWLGHRTFRESPHKLKGDNK